MIEEILRSKIGLDTERIGKKCIDASILRRMHECGIESIAKYTQLINSSEEELDMLIEAVTIPETWFFRSRESFEYLEYFIKTEWMSQLKSSKLKILSIPCCSGEEPYSIAITLVECGLPVELFAIEGADISSLSLAKAARGIYTRHSFRGNNLEFKDKYFREVKGGHELDGNLRKAVTFYRRNLLEYHIGPSTESSYDIIFCRNLFIYFDSESQKKAVDTLSRMLKENGLLFIGHAETEVLTGFPFVSVNARGSFAFRKSTAQEIRAPLTETQKLMKINLYKEKHCVERKKFRMHLEFPRRNEKKPETQQKAREPEEDLLEKAEKMADAGELEKASSFCKKYLAANKLDAKAYALMGIILMASKRDGEAECFFSKALYLKPDYYEALLNLSVLKQRNGDPDAAARLKARAAKAGK